MTSQQIIDKLESIVKSANDNKNKKLIKNAGILSRIKTLVRCANNKAGTRILLSCLLAKIDNPKVDTRNPYTEIGGTNSFSGRTYDEQYLTRFITNNTFPLNHTTGYLTPAFRNINKTLLIGTPMTGRPKSMYDALLQLLDDVQSGKVTAENLFVEVVKELIAVRDENSTRMASLLENLQHTGDIPLSSEQIVTILEQHLKSNKASRLPVLIVAAAYNCATELLKEKIIPLQSHNAADAATGSLGDIEITLADDAKVVTSYEMKLKRVNKNDIDAAHAKILDSPIDNYIFITTEPIDIDVKEYAESLYTKTNGVEFVVLDCVGFIRHFLHLFHRIRIKYLDEYQKIVLAEPESAVSRALKEVLLTIRQAAEASNNLPEDDE